MGHFHKPMCKVRPLFIILFALVVHAPQCVAKVDEMDHADEVQWIYVQLVETRSTDNLNFTGQTWSGQERVLTNDNALRSENCVCGDEVSVSSEGWCYIGETSNDPSSERFVSVTVPITAQPIRCSTYIVVGKSYLYCNKLNNSDICLSMLPEPSSSSPSSSFSLASSHGSNQRFSCIAGYFVCDGPSCYTWCMQVGLLSTDTSHGEVDLTDTGMRIMPKDEDGGSHLSETGTALIIISFLALVIILSIIWGLKQRRKGNAHAHSLAKKIWSHLKFKHDCTAEGIAGIDDSGHGSGARDADQREQRSSNHNSHSNHYYYHHHSPTGHRAFFPSDRQHEHLHHDISRSRRGSSNASDHGEDQLARAQSHESLTDAVFNQSAAKPVFTLEPVDGEEEDLYYTS
ncbi:hypothetical protein PoB_000397700 [Plakobranchus ocellatus]|uniref:Uncharacterized protein n=1 Tax=Plakobranchus ocellatus TaxID=259542 RepID=A0AAV3Y4W4_9GAST|nr:hypothetical protein PoB_000397700 [Plakobranchus ocellatus]